MRNIAFFFCILIALFSSSDCYSQKMNENIPIKAWVQCELKKRSIYCGEVDIATFYLYSNTPNVAYINECSDVKLENNKFDYFAQVEIVENRNLQKETIDGIEYYRVPFKAYAFTISMAGKMKFSKMSFKLGINKNVIYDDPFWGLQRGVATSEMQISMKNCDFSVKPLPAIPDSVFFSGAVGEFSVKTFLPQKSIVINEQASATIVIEGSGLLKDNILPEYQEAFVNGLKLKSISDTNNLMFNGKEICSKKVIECEFIPLRRDDCKIDAVKFVYFNPRTAQYETAVSNALSLEVKSSTIRRELISI